jgi:tetratricopeptide (TPR) repeat protein
MSQNLAPLILSLLLGSVTAIAQVSSVQAPTTNNHTDSDIRLLAGKLPVNYQPMSQAPKFNSNDPQMIPDLDEYASLKWQTPQWLQQFLKFPSEAELLQYLGITNSETRRKAGEAIAEVVNPAILPLHFTEHLIPLSGWAVLYEDWRNHGGTDVFLTKFQSQTLVIQLAETSNHVIIAVREANSARSTDFAGMVNHAYQLSTHIFNEHFKPVSPDGMKIFRTNMSPAFVYGYYSPKIEALTGSSNSQDLLTSGMMANERSESANATAVRYFSNGDFAAFLVLKPLFGAKLRNPFDPRFQPVNVVKHGETPFWERQAMAQQANSSDEQIKRRQMEEFLGTYLYDENGAKLSERVNLKDLERAYLDLSPQQRLALVGKKRIDELYTSGTRAFIAHDYRAAINLWTRMLKLDPDNPRAAILLNLAIQQYTKIAMNGNSDQAKHDVVVAAAMEQVARQQTRLNVKEKQEEQAQDRERAITDFRTRALNFLSEGNYSDSLKEWKKLLDVDPGNARALIFKDICEQKIHDKF